MHYLQTHTRTDTQTRTHTKGPDNPENKGTGNRHKRFENTRLGVAAGVLLRRRARGLHVDLELRDPLRVAHRAALPA